MKHPVYVCMCTYISVCKTQMYTIFNVIYSRPTGSEQKVPAMGVVDEIRSTNPDHIGGYQVALPIFAGIESKFGLCLPRFQAVTGK